MKKFIYFFILLSFHFGLWGCMSNMKVLEYKNIANFKITEYKENENLLLQITGLCIHSNYVVKKIYLKTYKDKLNIMIKISLFKGKNDSGKFFYTIKIPKNVEKVVLGNEKIEIWNRDKGK